MSLKNKRVLVTGGAGFIGNEISRQCIQLNAEETVIIDDMSAGFDVFIEDIKDQVTLIKGDICDVNVLDKAMENIDIVLHAAAQADVANSIRNIEVDFQSNVVGTYRVLESALKKEVDRVVLVSSASVYGNNIESEDNRMFIEDAPLDPLSPYAANKACLEQFGRGFYNSYGLKTTALRYFSIYGPKQIPKIGSQSWVVSIFVIRAHEKKKLIVFGDGHQIRDFTHVKDTAKATILAGIKQNAIGKIFNVGTGKSTQIIDLANKCIEIVREDVPIEYAPLPKGDPLGGFASTKICTEAIGYIPDTTLETGIRDFFEWWKTKGFKRKGME